MKKEEIRKEFFKLRIKHHSYNQCKRILKAKFDYEVTLRTLYRWSKKLNEDNWDLSDKSRAPKTTYSKITSEIENKIVKIRQKTGWGQERIQDYVNVSHWSVNKILNKHNLTSPSKRKKKRNNYIRFERKHPNSLWQIDHSDQKVKDKWLISVVDDCSRYSIGLLAVNRVTTRVVTKILDDLIKIHGKPKQILSDNGSAYGSKSKHSKFDRWCRRRGIKHIRSAVHSPTTCGKVERLFQTIKRELSFCKDINEFRMRYNHFRGHKSLSNKTPAQVYFDFAKLF
ncbi:MAG: DDE-type integrase/transposase/recombinase [Nanoarchaeota archaeon]|nr:DDE-type integrase/transposase/recombinase [Nanoarchaeota archaeon]